MVSYFEQTERIHALYCTRKTIGSTLARNTGYPEFIVIYLSPSTQTSRQHFW